MRKAEELTVETARLRVPQRVETRNVGIELTLRKLVLSALTMLGVGYVMVNIPVMILLGYFWSTIPISSQANVAAISGRLLFMIASGISSGLGVVIVLGGVKFYEGDSTKDTALLGVLLASFYLLCLGIGSTLLLPSGNIAGFLLLVAPVLALFGAVTYLVPNSRFKLAGSISGIVGGALLVYALSNVRVFDLVFDWGIPFTGPFMSLLALECIAVILGPVAALIHSVVGEKREERPLAHASISLLGLVYGIGVFVGSLVLCMSLWNLVWKSSWTGPLSGLPAWVISTVIFWSASLFLTNIGGVILIITACLGFVFVTKEFSQL
jgi:hypothetical protein